MRQVPKGNGTQPENLKGVDSGSFTRFTRVSMHKKGFDRYMILIAILHTNKSNSGFDGSMVYKKILHTNKSDPYNEITTVRYTQHDSKAKMSTV